MATLSVINYNSSSKSALTKLSTNNSHENMSVAAVTTADSGCGPNSISNISITAVTGSGRESKTFSKLTINNIFNENNGNTINITNNNNKSGNSINNVNTIVRKIKDFGICGAVNNANRKSVNPSPSVNTTLARKRPLIEVKPKTEQKTTQAISSKKSNKITKDTTNSSRTVKKASEAINRLKLQTLNVGGGVGVNVGVVQKPPGTPGRKGLPLPQAVARRNARERNRVKQVNNGFAALRERIPEEVAESFEAQSNGRGSVKKLSKVETLRMAVEYIRSLERLLGFNFPIGANANEMASVCGEDSFAFIKDEFDELSPSMDEHFDDSLSNYDIEEYVTTPKRQDNIQSQGVPQPSSPGMLELDVLPNITTLNGLQYIRIPGTNTYQLLTPDIFAGNSNSPPNSSMEDDQQFQTGALIDTNCLSPQSTMPLQSTSVMTTTPDLHSLPQSIMTTTTAETNTTAPAATNRVGSECLNAAMSSATLSRSPVPSSSVMAVSPLASSSLHQQQNSPQTTMISPATNELLLQTCATDRLSEDRQFIAPTPSLQQQMRHLQPRMIKQEYITESEFASTTTSSSPTAPIPMATTTTTTLIYQPPEHDHHDHHDHHDQIDQLDQLDQQQMFLGHTTLSISPPLDACQSAPLLTPVAPALMSSNQAPLLNYYDRDHETNSIYANVVAFKKENPSDVLLDTTAPLSDESMIDAIDWWEAHTPQSDASSVIL